jgi:hypothetical protein
MITIINIAHIIHHIIKGFFHVQKKFYCCTRYHML